MREYLTALLEEEQPSGLDSLTRAPVEQLLERGAAEEAPAPPEELVTEKAQAAVAVESEVVEETTIEIDESIPPTPPPELPDTMAEYREESFQALFFNVAGLNLAVPLKSLGGIHQWQDPKPLFGKPKWYMGMMPHREEQLNVVDSARWVMPEKYTQALAESLNYQYLVMLGESSWGMACETLVTTDKLEPDEVQWRTSAGKRPWLAGIVREKMCALINVEALIQLLEQGLDNSEKDRSDDPVSGR